MSLRPALALFAVVTVAATSVLAGSVRPAVAAPAATRTEQGAFAATLAQKFAEKLVTSFAEKLGSEAATQVLTSLGIGGEAATAAQLQEIIAQLQRIGEQTTELQNSVNAINLAVANVAYQSVAQRAQDWRNKIDGIEKQLSDAAESPTPAGRKNLGQKAFDAIAALNQEFPAFVELIAGGGSLSADPLIQAAFVRETADRFLTHDDSVRIRFFVDAYAFYAAKLGQLILNYRVASGDYSRASLETFARSVLAGVDKIEGLRRDAVPENTVVDARTGLEWATSHYGVSGNPSGDLSVLTTITLLQGKTGEAGWFVPSDSQLQGLVKGWAGSPSEWLGRNGGFAPLDINNSTIFWTRTVAAQTFAGPWYFGINMKNGDEVARPPGHNGGYGFIPMRTPADGAFLPVGFQPQV